MLKAEPIYPHHVGTKQIVIQAFIEYGRLSWDDFFEMSIVKDVTWRNEGGTELKNILFELMEENFIKPVKNDLFSWEYFTIKF
jgi:hypothetical protein